MWHGLRSELGQTLACRSANRPTVEQITLPSSQAWARNSTIRLASIVGGYAVLAAIGLWRDTVPGWVLPWAGMGFLLSGLFGAMHRASHGALFPNWSANAVLGRLCALVLLANYSLFNAAHVRHHRFLGDPRDTEPPLRLASRCAYLRAMLTTNSLVHFTWPALRAALLRRCPTWARGDVAKRITRDGISLLFWFALLGGVTVTMPLLMLKLYWGPLIIVLLLDAWYSIPEHLDLDGPTPRALARSIETAPLVEFIQWSENRHAAHHAYPHLPAMSMAAIDAGLRHGADHSGPEGYFRFHWCVWRRLSEPHGA